MDDRKRYEITCPCCGRVQYACKSIFHELGINAGGGFCIYCHEPMKLIFDYDRDTMTAEKLKNSEDREA